MENCELDIAEFEVRLRQKAAELQLRRSEATERAAAFRTVTTRAAEEGRAAAAEKRAATAARCEANSANEVSSRLATEGSRVAAAAALNAAKLDAADRERETLIKEIEELRAKVAAGSRAEDELRARVAGQPAARRAVNTAIVEVRATIDRVELSISKLENDLRRLEREASAAKELGCRAASVAEALNYERISAEKERQALNNKLQNSLVEIGRLQALLASKPRADPSIADVEAEAQGLREALNEAGDLLRAERNATEQLNEALAAAMVARQHLLESV